MDLREINADFKLCYPEKCVNFFSSPNLTDPSSNWICALQKLSQNRRPPNPLDLKTHIFHIKIKTSKHIHYFGVH